VVVGKNILATSCGFNLEITDEESPSPVINRYLKSTFLREKICALLMPHINI